MKIRLILAALLVFVAMGATAQELKFKSFELRPVDMTAKTNPVLDLNEEACALIRVAIASSDVTFQGNIVGEPKYVGGEWLVYVPADTRRIKVTRKGFLPITVEFDTAIDHFRTYELRIDTPTDPLNKVRAVIMPTISLGYEPMSYGAMVGVVKKSGGFVRYKGNFESVSPSFSVDENGVDESGTSRWFNDVVKYKRWAATAGYMHRVAKMFYPYFGVGYGERVMAWQTDSGEYASVSSSTYKGVEVELGVLARFGVLAVGVGVQSNQFKFLEGNISVGLMF